MKRFCFVLFMIYGISIYSQDYVDVAKLHYQGSQQSNYETTSGSTSIQESALDLALPVKTKKGHAIITGLAFEGRNLTLSESTYNKNLYTTQVRFGVNYNHTEKLSAMYLVMPKLSSDFEDIGANDFQMGALAIFKIKKSDFFKYKFGLAYNSESYGPLFIPIVGCYFISKNSKFEIDLNLPVAADINYKIVDFLTLGINFLTISKTYQFHGTYYNSENPYLSYASDELSAYVRCAIAKNFLLYGRAGYTFGRKAVVYDKNDEIDASIMGITIGDNRTALNDNIENGFIFRFGFIYRVYTK